MSILFPCGKCRYINSSFLADMSVQEPDVNAKYGACVTGWASPMRTSMAMCCKILASPMAAVHLNQIHTIQSCSFRIPSHIPEHTKVLHNAVDEAKMCP